MTTLQKQVAPAPPSDGRNLVEPQLKHFSYTCPGLHGPGCRQHIELREFVSLFEDDRSQISIPLFQRKYCWTDQHARDLFRDATRAGLSFTEYHSVGKIILKRENPSGANAEPGATKDLYADVAARPPLFICVDGQQRITTMSLLIAAIRDALLGVLSTTANVETAGGDSEATAASRRELQAGLRKEVNTLTECLFLPGRLGDLKPFLAAACARQQRRNDEDDDAAGSEEDEESSSSSSSSSAWAEELPEGEAFSACRFLPSYFDRKSFNESILAGMVRFKLTRAAADDASTPPFKTPSPSTATSNSRQWQIKQVLDQLVHKYLGLAGQIGQGVLDLSKATEFLSAVCALRQSTLRGIRIMWCEVLNEVDLAQIFLWFQEKALFGMGALLHNPNPGLDFHAMDLVRNLVLAPFMNLPREEQEAHHQSMWMEPIEAHFRATSQDHLRAMDEFLAAFVDHEEQRFIAEGKLASRQSQQSGFMPPPSAFGQQGTSTRGQRGGRRRGRGGGGGGGLPEGSLEKLIAQMREALRKPRGTRGPMDVYARFYAYYEYRLAHLDASQGMSEAKLVVDILDRMAKFVPTHTRA